MTERTHHGELVHISVVQQRLGLSYYQVSRLIRDGKLSADKIGRRTYVLAGEVDRYLETLRTAS